MWIWIAVVVVALVILGFAGGRLLGPLGGLRRAVVKLQRRQAEVLELQKEVEALQRKAESLPQLRQ
ncbi:hypothetical protein [Actinoplanes sp. NPDC048796]|uniref:hypothetical protein n=1 Tax=unclassified Actinoplanes TaxID=2626549 RepID=UPI0033CEB402